MTALLRLSGMDASTGQPLTGSAHLVQSIRDILTTPIGSRVMRRDYGSLLPELIDQPITERLIQQIRAATVMALLRWEPRVLAKKIGITVDGPALTATLTLTVLGTPQHTDTTLVVPLTAGATS